MSVIIVIFAQMGQHRWIHGPLMAVIWVAGLGIASSTTDGSTYFRAILPLLLGLFFLQASYVAHAGCEDWVQLRLVGAPRWFIPLVVAGQSLLVSMVGVLGTAAAVQIVNAMGVFDHGGSFAWIRGWGLAETALLMGIVALIGAAYPAWDASRVDLSQAMKNR
jgi:hypothetical protein